jgi:ribonuclease HI
LAADPLPEIEIWTDGGCKPNPGPGGWGAVLQYGEHRKELSGAEATTTNNRMELTAAIQALSALKRPSRVVLHTDSQYVKEGITRWLHGWVRKGWKTANREPVKNFDLWQALLAAMKPHDVHWAWVRGHSGNAMNERADELATAARDASAAAGTVIQVTRHTDSS